MPSIARARPPRNGPTWRHCIPRKSFSSIVAGAAGEGSAPRAAGRRNGQRKRAKTKDRNGISEDQSGGASFNQNIGGGFEAASRPVVSRYRARGGGDGGVAGSSMIRIGSGIFSFNPEGACSSL